VPSRRWIVRRGDGPDLASIVRRAASLDPAALEEGRVFVGRERVTDGARTVKEGDVIHVHERRALETSAVTILHRDESLVAADKPPALPTIADHRGEKDTLVARVAALIHLPPSALHPTSRLDVGVSGVVIFALTDAARLRLAGARERGEYLRRYVAIAERAPSAETGTWSFPIGRAADPRKRAVDGRDATHAVTRYRVLSVAARGQALLELEPETGRTHQLRVHAAHVGSPLLGDPSYGGATRVVTPTGKVLRLSRIALHARVVELGGDAPLRIEAPVPASFLETWSAVGGDPTALGSR
jgi:23S rRNA pseudouridine1911/1915/1917 synthase